MTTTSSAPVNEQGPSSDPNIASSSRPYESAPDLFTSTNVEDETMGGSFHTSLPRSTQAPPEAHKLLFKEVVGKLVKKVKLLEDKLKGRKRKFVMTDSDKEENAEQDVDPLIKLAKAAATSAVPTGGSHDTDIPPSSYIPSDEFTGGSDVPAGATTGPSADPSNKGKSLLLTLQSKKEHLGKKRKTDSDWNNIMSQVHANQGLTADLLGPDVTEDNFAERMIALIAKRRREFVAQRFHDKRNKPMTYAQQKAYMRTLVKNQSSTIYTTGWTMKHVKSFSDDQLKTEFDKIRTALAELQSQNIRRSLKRPGAGLEQASSKKSKPTEAPKRKSLGARKKSSTELDLTADDRSFIRVLSDDSDDSNNDDDTPILWSAFAAWEVVPTGLGDVNALYFMDKSSKYFTHLREILHLVDRKDLFKLYGMVVQYYEEHPLAGSGMILWGDLQVLFESHEGGVHVLETISGKILYMFADTPYPLSAQLMKKMLKHKLEVAIDGIGNDMTYAEQLIQFIKNQSFGFHLSFVKLVVNGFCFLENLGFWPLWLESIEFMKDAFGVGFEMIVVPSSDIVTTSRYVVPTGRVKVPAGRYVVPTGKDIVIVSAGRTKVIPAGRTILVLVCSFMLCDLDIEPLSLSLSSMPSCDLVSLTNMLILLHYLESFKSELAEVFVFKS
ncbi:hypothetical protein Tco_0369398 [Tanacetum coccineum]